MAADEAAVGYLMSLPTTEQRRTVASISRLELLAAVRALAGCQRCGFVEQVLAAFDPELAAAAAAAPSSEASWPPADHPALTGTADAGLGSVRNGPSRDQPGANRSTGALAWDLGQGLSSASPAAGPLASPSMAIEATAATATLAASIPPNPGPASPGISAPSQVLALLSDRGGSSDLVGLLQFAWRGTDGRGLEDRGGGSGSHRGGGGGGDWLALSDSLLSRPSLLRRFLKESVAVMQALADDVGDCRRHSGLPGPAELASTLARLDTQRCHTLQRLAAWGVLRVPTPPAAAAAGDTAVMGHTGPVDPRLVAAVAEAAISGVEAVAEAVEDPQLALAIEISLRDSAGGASAAASAPSALTRGPPPATPPAEACSPCGPGRGSNRQQQQHSDAPRRPQRTPPRPTGGAPSLAAAAACDGVGGRGSPSAWSLGTWPGRSSPSTTGLTPPGAAGLGLADFGPRQHGAAANTPPARALSPPLQQPPPAAAAGLEAQELPQSPPRPPQQQPDPQQRLLKAEAVAAAPPSPLPAAEAVAAAEGLADATVLVDGAAVAALSEGLRERVQHLVAQLVQVQQRRGRLEHACQHGILAAGRKLLLILLQMLWGELHSAATAAEAAASDMAEAASPEVASARHRAQRSLSPAGESGTRRVTSLSQPPPRQHPHPQADPRQPSQQSQPAAALQPQRRRRPRYEGLLADLVAGLGEDDTHLYLDLDLDTDLDPGLDSASELDLGMRSERGVLGRPPESAAGAGRGTSGVRDPLDLGLGYATDRSDGTDGGDGAGGGDWDAALAGAGSGSAYGRQSLSLPAATVAPLRRSSTALLSSPPSVTAAGRQSVGLRGTMPSLGPRGAAGAPPAPVGGVRSAPSAVATSGGTTLGWAAGGDACGWGAGGGHAGTLLESVGGFGGAGRIGGGCQPGCVAAREQQAEQLRVLQGQLSRCQCSQLGLEGEVGRLLDMLAEQRRTQEQATAAVRRHLAQWQAEPAALQVLGSEELAELASKLEAALSRVRAAQLQAAAERDLLCPVCWEQRKGLVFGCGHQTCCACGERLSSCPICREPVSLRIRVYS